MSKSGEQALLLWFWVIQSNVLKSVFLGWWQWTAEAGAVARRVADQAGVKRDTWSALGLDHGRPCRDILFASISRSFQIHIGFGGYAQRSAYKSRTIHAKY